MFNQNFVSIVLHFRLIHFINIVIIIIIIIIITPLESFSHQRKLMVFFSSLGDRKSPQVSTTLLSIQSVLNNAAVWMVSTRPPTSKSSTPLNNPLVTVTKAPIAIGIIVISLLRVFQNQTLADSFSQGYEWQ